MIKIIIKDRFYIPLHAVNQQALKKHCELKYNDKKDCRPSCPLAKFADRQCSSCPSDGILKMWQEVTTKNNNSFIAVPNGDSTLLGKIVTGKYKLIDRRPNVPMKHNLEWTGRLRRGELNAKGEKLPNQKQMLNAWRKHVATGETGGTIASPARSGKTVIGVAGIMAQRQRAFITASQRRFLLQFAMRFGELTNVKEFYNRGRYPVVFVDAKKWSEAAKYGIKVVTKWDSLIDKADVVIAGYQQLISEKGKRRLKRYISGKMGTFVGDEIHQAAADCYSCVINRSNVRYRMGLTATTIRKDCVSPETLVQTLEGKKKISSVKKGEEIMSYSFSSNQVEYKKIVAIHNRDQSNMLQISTDEGNILTTPDHEFWISEKNCFIKAKNLTTNDVLFSSP